MIYLSFTMNCLWFTYDLLVVYHDLITYDLPMVYLLQMVIFQFAMWKSTGEYTFLWPPHEVVTWLAIAVQGTIIRAGSCICTRLRDNKEAVDINRETLSLK